MQRSYIMPRVMMVERPIEYAVGMFSTYRYSLIGQPCFQLAGELCSSQSRSLGSLVACLCAIASGPSGLYC